jgi:hypothetical protein
MWGKLTESRFKLRTFGFDTILTACLGGLKVFLILKKSVSKKGSRLVKKLKALLRVQKA